MESITSYAAIIAIVALFIVKVRIFKRAKSVNTRFYNLLFYPPKTFLYTGSDERQILKQNQNLLSILILLIVVFYILNNFF